MVNLMFGANSPDLTRLLYDEIKKENMVLSGQQERTVMMEVTDLTEEEQIRFDAEEAIRLEKLERELAKKTKELFERRTAECKSILENMPGLGVALVFPTAKDMYSGILAELVGEAGLLITQTERIQVTEVMMEEIFYFAAADEEEEEDDDEGGVGPRLSHLEEFNEATREILFSKESVALMIKPRSGREVECIVDEILKLVYGEMMKPPGTDESPAHVLFKTETDEDTGEIRELNGIWAPPNYCMLAACMKVFFPKSSMAYTIPEPEPVPPHYAIIFGLSKFHSALEVMNKYAKDVLNQGFFTSDIPEEAELIAKTYHKLEKSDRRTFKEKLVIKVSAKNSELMFGLAQLEPQYISPNTDVGEKECELFFPEEEVSEEELEEEEEEEEDMAGMEEALGEQEEDLEGEYDEEEEVEEEQVAEFVEPPMEFAPVEAPPPPPPPPEAPPEAPAEPDAPPPTAE